MTVTVLVAALFLIGCAAGADSETPENAIPEGYPTIASPDFNGAFEITAATIDGSPVELGAAATRLLEFDVVTGAATVELSCDQRLGSFTMAEDHRASLTLTGRIEVEPCAPSDVDDALWNVIGQVERWESTAGGFQLLTAGGDDLVLTRI